MFRFLILSLLVSGLASHPPPESPPDPRSASSPKAEALRGERNDFFHLLSGFFAKPERVAQSLPEERIDVSKSLPVQSQIPGSGRTPQRLDATERNPQGPAPYQEATQVPQQNANIGRFDIPGRPQQPLTPNSQSGNPITGRPQYPGRPQPQFPGQTQPTFSGQPQPQFPGQVQPQFPGQPQPQFPGQVQPQIPGQPQPQFPGQPQPQFPGQPQPQFPGQVQTFPLQPQQPYTGPSEATIQRPQSTGQQSAGSVNQPQYPGRPQQPNNQVPIPGRPQQPNNQYQEPSDSTQIPDGSQPNIRPVQLPFPVPGVGYQTRPPFFPNQRPVGPNTGPAPFPISVPDRYLPTGVPTDKRECLGLNGTTIGQCTDAYTCGESGGKPVGICDDNSRVCCSFTSFCDFMTNVERVYLNNPSYPGEISNLRSCAFQLAPLPRVCQVRLDFLDFNMAPPDENGDCLDENALHISSNDPNAYIPTVKLCGSLSEEKWDPLAEDIPHAYIHFNEDDPLIGPSENQPPKRLRYPGKPENLLALNFVVTNHSSSWNVRLTQITCDGGARLQAPYGCGRYYTGDNGTISSFNYNDRRYQRNMDVTSCIRNEPGACGITYEMDPAKGDGFSVGNVNSAGMAYGTDCGGDYVAFSGQKAAFCGASNGKVMDFDTNKGPIQVHMHSDGHYAPGRDVGFKMKYKLKYDCRGRSKNLAYEDRY